jgi:RNA polymerase sigma-70 factor (ECF subfamily)
VTSASRPPPDPTTLLPHTAEGGLLIMAVRGLGNAEDAQDAVRETMARALEALRGNRIPVGVPIQAFVYGIARHVIADRHRHRVRERRSAGDLGALVAPDPSLDTLVRAEERDAVTSALATLPATDRELLERCFVRGERVATIAAGLGEPADRIRKRKSRALERLRERLQRRAEGHEISSAPTIAT